MPTVQSQQTKVWYSPTKRRRYFSRYAAVHAEAKAKILNRYPTEKPEYDNGFLTYPGFHFPSEEPEKFAKMMRRLKRMINKQIDTKAA
ncbi:hypothetical protein [Pantoea ananatis]|uniref:hypothetical protein n=1 Tax=Pantoea ananas TaxID=553 RepID=UPI001B30CDC6|nr:hypothetical protein [Pantoea ananatis]